MSEIKVEEYVRTDDGIIGKIKRIELDKNDISLKWYVFEKKRPDINIINEVYINKPYIVKHSKNIIDLIEAGDYVNGMLVRKGRVANGEEKLLVGNHLIHGMALDVVNIKSIVTKEQFQKIEYGGTI